MGNTLDMNKIRDDHQARTLRVVDAAQAADNATSEVGISAALKELALIWREEATAVMEANKRGAKGTAESLRDCATRVSAVAVAMEKYGLPESAAEPDPKDASASSTPASATSTEESAHPSDDELQRDLRAVHDGALTAADFRRKWPDPIHEDQMVEFLKNRRAPVSEDPAGDFLRDLGLGRRPNAGDWTQLDAHTIQRPNGDIMIIDDPFGILDTSEPTMLTVQWNGPDARKIINQVMDVSGFDPSQFTIGTAAAPPAWTDLPDVPVYELTDDPATWNPSPDHSSVSQANLAGECGLKWWLSKRRGAPERPSWALVGGKAFHEVVQQIEITFDGGANLSGPDIQQLWKVHFALAVEETERENPLFPQATWHASNKGKEGEAWWNLDGPEMVHRYLQWAANFRAQGWELLRTQDGRKVVELEFMAWLGGGPVKGFIDSAWYHPGKNMIAIIDWKSGKTQPADYFQQATYRHALEPLVEPSLRADLPRTWAGAFWDAREGALGKLVNLDERHPKAEVEMRLSGPRRIDAAGLYMPNVNTGYGGCNSCSLKRSCPVGSRIGKGEIS